MGDLSVEVDPEAPVKALVGFNERTGQNKVNCPAAGAPIAQRDAGYSYYRSVKCTEVLAREVSCGHAPNCEKWQKQLSGQCGCVP